MFGPRAELREVTTVRQFQIRFEYKGVAFAEFLRLDFYIDDCLLLELKAVERVLPIHKAQLFCYMKLLGAPIGLLINFHEITLKDGIYRLILPEREYRARDWDLESEKNLGQG